jgi:hypothetical protein
LFTDDDLKRLKERRVELKDDPLGDGYLGAFEIDALLARLEASERCAGYLGSLAVYDTTMEVLLKEWKKSCGQ